MDENIEILNFDLDDLLIENIEVIEIDDYDIEIIEVVDEVPNNLKSYDKKLDDSFLTKIRRKLSSKKFAIVSTCCAVLLITLTGVFVISNRISTNDWHSQSNVVYSDYNDGVDFSLNDVEYNTVLVNGEYEEKGASVFVDGIDYSSDVIIDDSYLDVSKVGTYHVIYTYPININQVKTLYRTVNVVDNEAPVIKLLGSNIQVLLVGSEYEELGYLVSDNSNEDLSDSVIISSNVDTSRSGVYFVNYAVSDSSGNSFNVSRKVVVKSSYYSTTNSVVYNSFTDNGLFLKGMVHSDDFQYKMMLKNKVNGDELYFDVVKTYNHYYEMNLDVTNLSNGEYEFYLVNSELELLSNNMNDYNKVVRAHIGNKLITMNYDKCCVNMIVQDFEYLYDVVIDPGHGGNDMGAVNGRYYERNINLEQSLYEKERYEQMGLRVLLLRDDNSNYGIMMGNSSLDDVERKGFAVGYYGTVSKVIYSNHHNSSSNPTSAGWEILVPAGASYEDLKIEHMIADEWSNVYMKSINPYYRFYTKDYETATPTNKIDGQVYDFDDYYAVIRIPNKLFGVKNVIFEGAYINNSSDMYWYYNCNNWKMLSEIKIKTFVESIGVTYIAP